MTNLCITGISLLFHEDSRRLLCSLVLDLVKGLVRDWEDLETAATPEKPDARGSKSQKKADSATFLRCKKWKLSPATFFMFNKKYRARQKWIEIPQMGVMPVRVCSNALTCKFLFATSHVLQHGFGAAPPMPASMCMEVCHDQNESTTTNNCNISSKKTLTHNNTSTEKHRHKKIPAHKNTCTCAVLVWYW